MPKPSGPNPHNADLPYFETKRMTAEDFTTAPERFVNHANVPCTPEELFAIFEDPESWTVWVVPGIAGVEWTSPKPYGVGTTRTVFFVGGMEVYEDFIAWDTGKHMAFTFTGTTQPVWSYFGEDYVVEDLGEQGCRLTWTVAYSPRGPYAALRHVVRPLMRWAFGRYMRQLEKYCRDWVARNGTAASGVSAAA